MMIKIKNVLTNSNILKNVSWMFILQVFNTVVPMLTLPYVTRILQPEKYGEFSIALNIIMYLQVIVEFGFELNGSRKVALAQNESEINKIFNEILFSRFLLLFLSFIILLLLTLTGYFDFEAFKCSLILFMMVVGIVFQCNWLYQGKEDMKFITYTNVIGRTISVLLIFLLVKNKNDIYIYCLLYALNILASNFIGYFIAIKKYNLKIYIPSINDICCTIKDSVYLFISSAMGKIFCNLGITILGAVSTEYYVGVYSAIQKIPNILIMLFTPVGQAIYPYVSKKFSLSYIEGAQFVKKICILILIPFLFIAAILIALNKIIIGTFLGQIYANYSTLIIPLTIWLILSILNNFLGIQMLVGAGYQKEYSKAFQLSVIVIIISNLVLDNLYGMYGVAWSTMISELSLTLILSLYNFKLYHANLNKLR